MNIAGWLAESAKTDPDRMALIDGSSARSITVGQLASLAEGIGQLLDASETRLGDRVLILTADPIPAAGGIVAALSRGAVAVLPERHAVARARHLVPPHLAVVAGRWSPAAWACRAWRVPWVDGAALLDAVARPRRTAENAAEPANLRAESLSLTVTSVPSDAPAVVTFSSGSLGDGVPRPVWRTHGVLAKQHAALRDALPVRPDDVELTAYPMFALHNLASGVPTVLSAWAAESGSGPRLAELIRRHGVTTASLSPGMWSELLSAADGGGLSLIRRAGVGGAPVTPSLARNLQAAGVKSVIGLYGSSEVEPMTRIDAEDLAEAAEAVAQGFGVPVGMPVPGVTLRVVPDEGGGALSDGSGILEAVGGLPATRAATGADRGAAASAATRAARGAVEVQAAHAARPGWLATGDRGYLDARGGLWLTGRQRQAGLEDAEAMEAAAVELGVRAAGLALVPRLMGGHRRVLAVVSDASSLRPAPGPDSAEDGYSSLAPVTDAVADGRLPVDAVVEVPELPLDTRHGSRVDRQALARRLRPGFVPRMRLYLAERFPLPANVTLIVSYFAANAMLAAAVAQPGPVAPNLRWVAGAAVLLAMFFVLRVIDEHRDRAIDLEVHPDRALSRGLVDLSEIRRLGWLAVGLQVGLSAVLGLGSMLACLGILAYDALMAREFFAPSWLDRHRLVGTALHMLVMPAFALFVFSAVTGRLPWTAPGAVLAYAWVSYAVGLAYEIARKIRAPEDERPGLITYSAERGPYQPAVWTVAALAVAGAISMAVGFELGVRPWYHGAVLVLLAAVVVGVVHFRTHTSRRTAARLQAYAGLFIFAFDWLLVIELAGLRGVTW